jgi:hypothetical protein
LDLWWVFFLTCGDQKPTITGLATIRGPWCTIDG